MNVLTAQVATTTAGTKNNNQSIKAQKTLAFANVFFWFKSI